MMMQVPEHLAETMLEIDGVQQTLRTRDATDAVMTVWSVGNALITLAVAPEGIARSFELIRSWLGSASGEKSTLTAKGPGGAYESGQLNSSAEFERAVEAARKVLMIENGD